MPSEQFAKTIRLYDPSTGKRYVPVKSLRRSSGEYGVRILRKGDNRAASGEVTESEEALVRALEMGLRVRCRSCEDLASTSQNNAYALDGKRGLELERM
jgi:hypothetical protein